MKSRELARSYFCALCILAVQSHFA